MPREIDLWRLSRTESISGGSLAASPTWRTFGYAQIMTQRIVVKVAVYLVLKRDGQYLFMQRRQTGYCDGLYSLPAGHVDEGEVPSQALIREAAEEIGVALSTDSLRLVHVIFRKNHYLNLFFLADHWKGEPQNLETQKCGELRWATLQHMRGILAPEVEAGLIGLETQVAYSELQL
jgi:8-oxo-dGTP diphosphatase